MPPRPALSAPPREGDLRLRILEEADVDWFVAFECDPEAQGPANWPGSVDTVRFRQSTQSRIERDCYVGEADGTLLIELRVSTEHERIGTIAWRPRQWGPHALSRCFVIGVAIDPAFRRVGLGTAAQRLLVDYLFSATTVHRLEADVAVDNIPEIRALRRLGFVEEGTVRDAEFRSGDYLDHKLFGILRRQWVSPEERD